MQNELKQKLIIFVPMISFIVVQREQWQWD